MVKEISARADRRSSSELGRQEDPTSLGKSGYQKGYVN
jgi:hypothetical protein